MPPRKIVTDKGTYSLYTPKKYSCVHRYKLVVYSVDCIVLNITSFLFKSVSNNLSTHTLHLASSLPLHCLIYQFTPAQLASQPPSPNLLQSWSSIFTSPPSKLTNNVEIRTRYARDLCSAISYRPTPDLWVGSDCDMTSKIIHLSYIRVKISVLQRQLRFGKNRIV